jgi:hypothetical protein
MSLLQLIPPFDEEHARLDILCVKVEPTQRHLQGAVLRSLHRSNLEVAAKSRQGLQLEDA